MQLARVLAVAGGCDQQLLWRRGRFLNFSGVIKAFSTTKGSGASPTHLAPSTIDRASSAGVDWKSDHLVEFQDVLRSHMRSRRSASEETMKAIDAAVSLEAERRRLDAAYAEVVAAKKSIGREVSEAKKAQKGHGGSSSFDRTVQELMQRGEANRALEHSALKELEDVESKLKLIFSQFPNLLDDRVPEGDGAAENVVVASHFEERRLMSSGSGKSSVQYLNHDDLARANGWMDLDAANRMSGTRFNILTGALVRFERELTRFFLDFHTKRRSSGGHGSGGYREVAVPYIVSRDTLQCTGHLPKFHDDLFGISHQVMGQSAFLIPTAEVPITSMFMHQVLDSRDLPLSFAAHTPCFRAEAGAYGKDTRGIMRQHQFHKVELVTIASPETSAQLHEQMVSDVEALVQALGLPYRKALLCSGDTGFAASICYDIECWFPGQQAYREVSSISNCTDFQSKRLGFIATDNAFNVSRIDRRANGVHPHTINGSGLAIGRALAAILENYQCEDGSVNIPQALIPFCPSDWEGKIPTNDVVKKNTIRLTAKR